MALGSTQFLTKEYQGYLLRVKEVGAWGWQPCHVQVRLSGNAVCINLLKPYGPVQTCTRIVFTLQPSKSCFWYLLIGCHNSLREEVCLRVPHMRIEMCVIIRLGLSEPSNMRALYRTGQIDSVCRLLSHSRWRYWSRAAILGQMVWPRHFRLWETSGRSFSGLFILVGRSKQNHLQICA
jgi:hypothetical protein